MSNNLGVDISNNNGDVNIDSLARSGVKFVYLKATEGATFYDSHMDSFYNSCKNNNLKVGAYHFLVKTSSPEAQARNFYHKIINYSWDLIPILDIERNFSGLTNYVLKFIKTFNELCNLELGLYTYTSFIRYLYPINSSIKNMKFWEANYNNVPWKLTNSFFINRIGHQYTDHAKLGSFTGDANVFTENILIKSPLSDNGSWILDNSKWCYKHTDGSYTKNNWEKIKNDWYYFDDKGYMLTGWIKYNGNDYLLHSNGSMAHDTVLYGYSFASNGIASKK